MRFDVLTLFPAIFDGYLGQSLLKKAIDARLVDVQLHDIRLWSKDKHHKVDDRPFGGGPGMILQVEPVVECVEAVQGQTVQGLVAEGQAEPGHLVMLSPRGRTLNQKIVEELAAKPRLLPFSTAEPTSHERHRPAPVENDFRPSARHMDARCPKVTPLVYA